MAGYLYVFNDIHSCGQCSGNYSMILQSTHQKSPLVYTENLRNHRKPEIGFSYWCIDIPFIWFLVNKIAASGFAFLCVWSRCAWNISNKTSVYHHSLCMPTLLHLVCSHSLAYKYAFNHIKSQFLINSALLKPAILLLVGLFLPELRCQRVLAKDCPSTALATVCTGAGPVPRLQTSIWV